MSTKARKRKNTKGGGPKRTAPGLLRLPVQGREQLEHVKKGSKGRNWFSLKERYMAYEFLTYTEMASATGIGENLIGKHACIGKNQPETWKDERARRTNELAEAGFERQKAAAVPLNARLRDQIQAIADLLEAKGQQSLLQADGKLILSPREAVMAIAEAARIKQGLIGGVAKTAAQTSKGFTAGGSDSDEDPDEASGVVVVPAKETAEAWQQQQKARTDKEKK